MCGISGKVNLGAGTVDYFDIKKMDSELFHRGPDDSGIFISSDKKVGLGNQRLSIIDLSQNGHMPMGFKNKYTITFNGEIYNFKDLRKTLKKDGYEFKSLTDTEVILALYDKYKTGCLQYLRGMFAFAIFDKKQNLLFMARDRVGKKPFKYCFDGNVLIFASELKAILTQKEVKREIDESAIYDYLTFGYTFSPQTGFSNIQKLEPGNYLILDLNKKTLNKVRYWFPDYVNKLNLSEDEWQKSIMQKLNESVKLRMISDVPIGAFLSGGIDSSTVVALMAQNSSKPIKTFTIGFKDKNWDESQYAENIVRKYKTDHRLLIAEPHNTESLPELAKIYEEPYADASSIVTQMVCRLAKKDVTVILNGDGGDENFAGYERSRRIERDFLFDRLSPIKPILVKNAQLLAKIYNSSTVTKVNKFLSKSLLPIYERYGSYIQYFSENDKRSLYKSFPNSFVSSFRQIEKAFTESNTNDKRDAALYFDMTRYLPEDLLAKVDIASMNSSLEARSPFLDQELIELACKIPFNLKYRNGNYKYVLKNAIKNLVPDENVYRTKKGFSIPLDIWFEGSLNKYARGVLLDKKSFILTLFKKEFIDSMLKKHSTTNDFGPRLWSLLSLELWHKAYFG